MVWMEPTSPLLAAAAVGEVAAGAAEAGAAAGAAEAGAAGAGEAAGAGGVVEGEGAATGQVKNLQMPQFSKLTAGGGQKKEGTSFFVGPQVDLPANTAYDDPGHTS